MEEFDQIKEACRRVVNIRPSGDEYLAVMDLLKHIRIWQQSGTEAKATLLFKDKEHDDASVYHFGDTNTAFTRNHTANEIYQIVSDDGVAPLTGLQLTSLATQWLDWLDGKNIYDVDKKTA